MYEISYSQWSTSTYADSALYVCPGFVQTILTFDDGSSIICGALNDSRYAQKLDPYGNKVWPQPVLIMNTPGTGNDGISTPVSDGNGGCFVWWNDYRGAAFRIDDAYTFYFNNAFYMQHIDKNGNVLQQNGGMQVDSIAGGQKDGYGVADGEGGIIFYMSENIYDTTSGAFRKARTWLVRYDGNGQKIWMKDIDTSSSELDAGQPTKFGDRIMISTIGELKFFEPITGDLQSPPPYTPKGGMITYKDSIGYDTQSRGYEQDSIGVFHHHFAVTQISSTWDSVWCANYTIDDESDGTSFGVPFNGPYVTDKKGGLFTVWVYTDRNGTQITRAQWITKLGPRWKLGGKKILNKVAPAIFNAENKLGIYFSNNTAQLFDTNGAALWDTNNVIISDPGNVYSPVYASDKNGGCIIAYWSTLGGIFAQHTGRVGKVGQITKVPTKENTPLDFELSQNFPNPFNPTTTFSFEISRKSFTTLKVFDILGREVTTLIAKELKPGHYSQLWHASNCSSGVYFYLLQSGAYAETKKMLLLK
jgi:hypothetical protein